MISLNTIVSNNIKYKKLYDFAITYEDYPYLAKNKMICELDYEIFFNKAIHFLNEKELMESVVTNEILLKIYFRDDRLKHKIKSVLKLRNVNI